MMFKQCTKYNLKSTQLCWSSLSSLELRKVIILIIQRIISHSLTKPIPLVSTPSFTPPFSQMRGWAT